jgi:hypothetical protein
MARPTEEDMDDYYWLDPDSKKVWSFVQARWLDQAEIPNGTVLDRTKGIDDIRARIAFYGGELGELE